MAEEHFDFEDDEDSVKKLLNLVMDDEDKKPFLAWAAQDLVAKGEQVEMAVSNLDQPQKLVSVIRTQRHMSVLRLPQSSRVSDNLSRALFSTLSELRRQ